MPPELSWRVWLALGFIFAMWALSYITSRPKLKETLKKIRFVVNAFWLLSPVILYIFLAGVPAKAYNIGLVLTGEIVVLGIYLFFWFYLYVVPRF